jgi:hypothetical protein
MDLHNLEHGHAESEMLFGAANAGCADSDGPYVRNLVEVARRTTRVSVGAFASQFVKAPAFAVSLITKLFGETTRIKVRSSRALLVNVAVKCEFWAPLRIEFRQRAGRSELQHHAE